MILFVILNGSFAFAQTNSIINSKHNLSTSGPGNVRATSEQEICIFCHAPHNASPVQPLWNRNTPVSAYTVYSSTSLHAAPGQPTGSSKLCLSCHDGTIAIGSVLSRDQQIAMAGGITTLPPGATNLGTDLSDDHPISFLYDTDLAVRNPKLKPPGALPPQVKLDSRQQMQCTSCHDAHNNMYGSFLVMDNTNSQLCVACHQEGSSDVTAHSQCNACHQNHTAPSRAFLLHEQTVTDTCISCHNGATGPNQGSNIANDLAKIDRHDTHPLTTAGNHVPANISCEDCHEPHTILSATANAPQVSPKLGNVGGINSAGAVVSRAQFEYEVCFKCHAEQNAVPVRITRQLVQLNTRLQFATSAVSYHPVEAPGRSTFVPSLSPGYTTASSIYCTDCHNSDSSKIAGGTGPNGPHGSGNLPLLALRYDTTDNTPESATAYALCYRCHDRSSILANQSFPTHSLHVVNNQTPCSACHDAHGISSNQGTTMHNSSLINFDTTIVHPDPVTNKLEFDSQGPGHGQCFLSCHNSVHSPKSY
jgi:predicted CXXCH cytochrome family protein